MKLVHLLPLAIEDIGFYIKFTGFLGKFCMIYGKGGTIDFPCIYLRFSSFRVRVIAAYNSYNKMTILQEINGLDFREPQALEKLEECLTKLGIKKL